MSAKLVKVSGKHLVFDNSDEDFYKEHLFLLENKDKIVFSPNELVKLKELEKNNLYLEIILNSCPGIHKYNPIAELVSYKNSEDLNVYYLEIHNYIAVIALGETQPGRYKIYIEGVFQKQLLN